MPILLKSLSRTYPLKCICQVANVSDIVLMVEEAKGMQSTLGGCHECGCVVDIDD